MIQRRIKNLKVGDLIWTKVPDLEPHELACGEIVDIEKNSITNSFNRTLVLYKVFNDLDTTEGTRYRREGGTQSWYFEKTITVLEPDELDLLRLGQ